MPLFPKGSVALIILYLMATVEYRSLFPAILEAMEMHFDASLHKGFDAVKHIDHTPVVGRIWHIERDDM